MTDRPRDYVLGVNPEEIERLALQHRVWRERALKLWRRAALRRGASVLDIGCGPGWAALDLAEIVGPQGRVIGVDRAPAYVAYARRLAETRELRWLDVREAELSVGLPVDTPMDFAWCRWVLTFTKDRAGALAVIGAALRPGAMLTIQEYLRYGVWSLAPPAPAFTRFVDAVMESWRDEGGEPDIAMELPDLLVAAGFDLLAFDVFIDVVEPHDPFWEWPATFARSGAARLVELGKLTAAEARDHLAALDAAEAGGARMVTPAVAQLIARRR